MLITLNIQPYVTYERKHEIIFSKRCSFLKRNLSDDVKLTKCFFTFFCLSKIRESGGGIRVGWIIFARPKLFLTNRRKKCKKFFSGREGRKSDDFWVFFPLKLNSNFAITNFHEQLALFVIWGIWIGKYHQFRAKNKVMVYSRGS